jgi:mono/diheme cytochrome c family protein
MTLRLSLALILALVLAACGSSDGPEPAPASSAPAAPSVDLPVASVELGPIDPALATEGQGIFETRCMTCHKMDSRYIGPPLGDVAGRREPEWIMNMVLAPEKMLQADAEAQALLAEYSVPMTNQNLSEEEARAILEYLRQVHEGA